jgi:hypothetical protein
MKKLSLSVFILMGVLVLSLPAFANSTSAVTDPVFTVISPRVGQQLKGGSEVTLRWNLVIEESILQNPWAECELYLVDDHGLSLRLTPQLNITARTFNWTVPMINTTSARLVLQFGVEGEGELAQLPAAGTFSIRSKLTTPPVELDLPSQPVIAGSDLNIRWNSTLDSSYVYDVMISYDRGGHFFKAGTTTESRYVFPVDQDIAGTITVKIVARGADGNKISTLLAPNATIHVKD